MENPTNISQSIKHKKKPLNKALKPTKQIKTIIATKAGKISNKSKTLKKTGEKSESSLIAPSKSTTSKIIHKKNPNSVKHEKISCVFSKLTLDRTYEKSKTRCLSGHSFRANKKKENFLVHAPQEKKFILKQKILLGVDNNADKMTPRPAYPSPQGARDLMWTPEQVRAEVSKKISTISDKKKKKPEIGYYIKRFSLHDINKTLYTDNDISKISFDTPRKQASNSFILEVNQESSDIMKFNSPDKQINVETKVDPSFQSPTRLLKVHSSPDGKLIPRSPEFLTSKAEPKAPRKTLAGFESPGSFNFSISSSSSYEGCDIASQDKGRVNVESRHIECQTDILDTNDDEDIRKGLALLGKLLKSTN